MRERQVDRAQDLPFRAVFPFFALTFAITWGAVGGYIVAPGQMAAVFGEISGQHPIFFLATWGPAIAGFALVWWHGGWRGVRAFLSRLLLWRVSLMWWLLIIVGIPLVFMVGSLIKGGPLLAEMPPGGAGTVVAAVVFMLALGPVEEFGWRGVAQPLLQRALAPFWAGAILGTAWGLWHLPAFYLAGVVFAEWHFLPFFVGNVTLAILVTPVFNAARGSLALPMLFHWQLINPVWPDAQPWDTWLFVAVTAAVVWACRRGMFSRVGAATTVIPRREDAGETAAEASLAAPRQG